MEEILYHLQTQHPKIPAELIKHSTKDVCNIISITTTRTLTSIRYENEEQTKLIIITIPRSTYKLHTPSELATIDLSNPESLTQLSETINKIT